MVFGYVLLKLKSKVSVYKMSCADASVVPGKELQDAIKNTYLICYAVSIQACLLLGRVTDNNL